MHSFRSFVALVNVCLLVSLPTTAPATAQERPAPQRLRILTLEGQNAVNYIPIRTGTAPVIEVRDELDRPLEGAAVTFNIVAAGAGATFEGGQSTQSALTDYRGQAGVRGYAINDKPGRFTIEVTATFAGRTARATITQVNSIDRLPPELGGARRSRTKTWILLGIAAAAGAGAGIYFATRSSNTPISVGIGPVGIGGPR